MRFLSVITIFAAFTIGASSAPALDLKKVIFETSAGKVVFSHQTHLEKKSEKIVRVSCKTCHATDKKSNVHYTMAEMEKGKSCGKCHNGRVSFAITKCVGCHKVKEITYQVKQTGPVQFSHARHLRGLQCNSCHTGLYATGPNLNVSMAEMKKGKSCGACHNGTRAFNIDKCTTCHPTKEIVFKVKEMGPTHFSHNKHLGRYSCSACHTKLYAIGPNRRTSMAAMNKGKSCGACHNGTEAFAVADCVRCHPVKDITFKVTNATYVKFSHTSHLNMFKCGSCHTHTFSLKTGNKPVSMAEMKKAKSCGACHDGASAFSVRGNCDSCHVRG